jgi:PAS domain S-box-containing protein
LNPVAERLTGWKGDAARGRLCDEVFRIVNARTRNRIPSPVADSLQSGTFAEISNGALLVASDGSERPIDDSAAPIRDNDGRIVGAVLVFRDVSERKRAEADRLAGVAERERLLKQAQAAQSEAEQANRSKDEFVAMVSHELRTPLNAIMGWTQLLKGTPEDGDTLRRGIEVIERNATSQAQLISDLLDMSRIISGKLKLDVQDVDLVALSRTAVETTSPAADAKHIELVTTFEEPTAATTGDPVRLQQCIWNLLSNAIKFTPSGGRVGLRLARRGSQVEISVWDSGVGIAPDFLSVVFERFRQVETGPSRHTGGLGLGLAIVRQLAEMHGGQVRAESDGEGKGSTFTLTLPIRALRTNVTAAKRAEPAPDALERIRVLVVEDDPDNREVLRRLLERHHAVVGAAGSAGEALEMLPRVQPHVLVSDIGLPGVDGYELIRRVRLLGGAVGETIPAIALTARASAEDRSRALRVGFQAHLAKPVAPGELVAAVASLAAPTG